MCSNCTHWQSRNRPKYQGPSYALLWLVLNRRFRLIKKLGEGSSREAWLARGGKVVKMPKRTNWCYALSNKRGIEDYNEQTRNEIKLMKAGQDRNGLAVARGEHYIILGLPIIVMEFVTDARTVFPYSLPDSYPLPHRTQYYRQREKLFDLFSVSYDMQWGLTHDGRAVYYDAGVEKA